MSSLKLISLSPGSAIIEIDGERFNVNGEGYGDGTWHIFPMMVYREGTAGKWELIPDKELRYQVIAGLRKVWPENPGGWPELILLKEDMGEDA